MPLLAPANLRPIFLGLTLWWAGTIALLAQVQPGPVTPKDFYSLAQIDAAQRLALAQGKPIGFLLTWPMYFAGAPNYHRSGAAATAAFHEAFKDQAVLINIDHSTGELDRVPKVALDAFHSPAEGGFAPCLCLVNPSFTKLIGIIPLWKSRPERDQSFAQFHALIVDKARWWNEAAADAAAGPVVPAPVAPPQVPVVRPAVVSSGFAREMELTRQAEQQRKAATPPPGKP